MTRPLLVALAGSEHMAEGLARAIGADVAQIETRRFPDEEVYLRYLTDPAGRRVVVLSPLDRPDGRILPLLFAAHAARDLGAASVGLVAPYLAYMRQDRRFHPGEAVTSTYFGRLVSRWVDWLVTVDPHLHRRASLDEIYAVPSRIVHAAPVISDWIVENIERPVLVGPDRESEQWVSTVAGHAAAPYIVLTKSRHGDRDVEIAVPDVETWRDYTPVLVDDIISTAQTMIVTVRGLEKAGMPAPVCIGVHAVFAGSALGDLRAAGVARIVTCNTIPHETNAIDLTEPIAKAVSAFIGRD